MVQDAIFIAIYQATLLLFTYILLHNRKKLNPPAIPDTALRFLARDRDTSLAPIRFLFEDYTCEAFYFEIVDL